MSPGSLWSRTDRAVMNSLATPTLWEPEIPRCQTRLCNVDTKESPANAQQKGNPHKDQRSPAPSPLLFPPRPLPTAQRLRKGADPASRDTAVT